MRVGGRVSGVRAFYVWSPVGAPPTRAPAAPAKPAIVTRAGWSANESIVRDAPSYASRIGFAVVHHTAGARPTSPAQSAAIVRGIQAYHVNSNGWDDIGYNFLVDPFGQVFEGRRGGITKNVVGAHAQGFNTGSVGVSLLGTYTSAGISKEARAALTGLLAWRLDVAHVDPTSKVDVDLRRQREVPVRPGRLASRGLRSPRHRADRVPRRGALRDAREHRRGGARRSAARRSSARGPSATWAARSGSRRGSPTRSRGR